MSSEITDELLLFFEELPLVWQFVFKKAFKTAVHERQNTAIFLKTCFFDVMRWCFELHFSNAHGSLWK